MMLPLVLIGLALGSQHMIFPLMFDDGAGHYSAERMGSSLRRQVRRLTDAEIVGSLVVELSVLRLAKRGSLKVLHSIVFTVGATSRLRHTICGRPSWAEVAKALDELPAAGVAQQQAAGSGA